MEKFDFNKAQTELLDELAKSFANVVIVIDPTRTIRPEVYVAAEFRHEDKESMYNSLRGFRKITDIIAQNSTYINSQDALGVVTTAINGINPSSSNKECIFSNKFIWIKL